MFEVFSGERHRAPRRNTIPVLISAAAHVIVMAVAVSSGLRRVP